MIMILFLIFVISANPNDNEDISHRNSYSLRFTKDNSIEFNTNFFSLFFFFNMRQNLARNFLKNSRNHRLFFFQHVGRNERGT